MTASAGDEPIELADALERVLGSLGAPPSDLLSTVFHRWEEVVGADVARHCRPTAVEGDRLVIVASDSMWASEVRWLAEQVLERVNELSSTDRLRSIAVRVRPGPSGP